MTAHRWTFNYTVQANHIDYVTINVVTFCFRLTICVLGMTTNVVVLTYQYRNRLFGINPLRLGCAMTIIGLIYNVMICIITICVFESKNEILGQVSLIFGSFQCVMLTAIPMERTIAVLTSNKACRRNRTTNFSLIIIMALFGCIVYGYGLSEKYATFSSSLALTVFLPLVVYLIVSFCFIVAFAYNRKLKTKRIMLFCEKRLYKEVSSLTIHTEVVLKGSLYMLLLFYVCYLPTSLLRLVAHVSNSYEDFWRPDISNHVFHLRLLPFLCDPVLFAVFVLRQFHMWTECKTETDFCEDKKIIFTEVRQSELICQDEEIKIGSVNHSFEGDHIMETRV